MQKILIGTTSQSDFVTGQSIAFDLLTGSLAKEKFSTIDISFLNSNNRFKAIMYLSAYVKLILLLIFKRYSSIYITIAQSRLGFFRDLGFIWISYLFRKQILLHLHGGNYLSFYNKQSKWLQKIIKITLSKADKLIVLSEAFLDQFSFVNNYQDKTIIVHNGVRPPGKKYIKELTSPINLLYLSNLIEGKGYLDVLFAARELKKMGVKFNLAFAGKFMCLANDERFESEKDAQHYFHHFIADNQLEQQVSYAGVVSGEKKEQLLQSAHYILLPSYYKSEGQPISIIEGMAYSCVPITTAYRDLQYMVIDGYNGIIVDRQSPVDIAKKIVQITSSKYRSLSENAYNHFLCNYSLEQYLTKMKALLE
ncbi:MAG: glycosyltransferase family 4 protein [Flavisolibacter sp.]